MTAGPPTTAAASPISDLAGVTAWLETVAVGDVVAVGSSQFAAPLVAAVFALLPDGDPSTVTVTAVDAATATLRGTGDLVGVDGSTARFTWSTAGSALALTLEIALPPTTEWDLVEALKVTFHDLVGTFTPNPTANTVGLRFKAKLKVGDLKAFPVEFVVPSLDTDWTLLAEPGSLGALDGDALTALAGGHDPLAILGGQFDLADLSLTRVEMALRPPTALTMVGLGLAYAPPSPWTLFGGRFQIDEVSFDVRVFQPFTTPTLQAELTATMSLPGIDLTFDVGGVYPDQLLFAGLPPGQQLDLTAAMTALGATLPAGFPTISLDTLLFKFWVVAEKVTFEIGIAQPFAIIGELELDAFFFDLQVDWSGATPSVVGLLTTTVGFGTTRLTLAGSYDAGGLSLSGGLTDVDLGALVTALAAKFTWTAPAALTNLELASLTVALTTGAAASFDFTLVGSTTVAGVAASLSVVVHQAFDAQANRWDGTATGTLTVGALTFTVTFDDGPGVERLTATYVGDDLGLDDVIAAFGLAALPPIPPALDLALTSAGFVYDFTTGELGLFAQSARYGALALASPMIAGARQYVVVLAADVAIALADLPLIGADLARIEAITVDDLVVTATSLPSIPPTAVAPFAAVLALLPAGTPAVPAAGVPAPLLVQATVHFGTQAMPLAVSLGAPLAPSSTGARALATAGTSAGPVTAATSADGATWYTVEQAFGPVTLGRIGVAYQSTTQTVWFELDASLALGPLAVALTGLGIGSPVESFAPQFTLGGLTVDYQTGPLTIAGTLVNLQPPGAPGLAFAGGLTLGADELTLTAFGYYGDGAGFPSLFVFADLAYDLGGPPALFVTGLALGFGYNSALAAPTLAQVPTFPLLAALDGASPLGPTTPPLQALDALLTAPPGGGPAWVTATPGALWLAAGVTFTSFGLVASRVMLVVELGAALAIEVLGTSTAQFPQPGDGDVRYAFVELELLAQLDPAAGVFSVQAQLAPSSFLLDAACVLTGGFAFFVWSGPSPHAGDFVLTLGGYTAGFVPPSYYPTPPPVGFHWTVDDTITLSGGAYLAITPAVFMAGGRLDATYQSQSGATRAWFDAAVDVVLRWKPFWVEADLGITVGASHRLNLAVTTTTITVELGCQLTVWGPPTGGTVELDWWVVKFTIAFGTPRPTTPAIGGWDDLLALLPSAAGAAGAAPTPLTVTPVAGLLNPTTAPSTTADATATATAAPWFASASQFAFATASAIPATTASVGATQLTGPASFDVFPLGWTAVTASHQVTIVGTAGDASGAFTVAPSMAAVPVALWGAPAVDADGRPLVPGSGDQLVPGQLVGLVITARPPVLGASVGAIAVASQLATEPLDDAGAIQPLSATAPPSGDVAVADPTLLATMADPDVGIASVAAQDARRASLAALASLGYAPLAASDPMTRFAAHLDCAFVTSPLWVPGSP